MSVLQLHPRKRLGDLLSEAGLLDRTQLNHALEHQRRTGERLGRALVGLNLVDEETVTVALSQQVGLPAIHLDSAPIAPDVKSLLPLEFVERHRVFPLSLHRKHKLLRVATADPQNSETARALTRRTGHRVLLFVTGEGALERAIQRHYHGQSSARPDSAAPVLGVPQSGLAFEWPTQLSDARKAQLHSEVAALEEERLELCKGHRTTSCALLEGASTGSGRSPRSARKPWCPAASATATAAASSTSPKAAR